MSTVIVMTHAQKDAKNPCRKWLERKSIKIDILQQSPCKYLLN